MLQESGAVGPSTQQEEAEKSSQQNGGGEPIKMADVHGCEAEKAVDSRDEVSVSECSILAILAFMGLWGWPSANLTC